MDINPNTSKVNKVEESIRKQLPPKFLNNRNDIKTCKRLVEESEESVMADSRIEGYNQFKIVLENLSKRATILSLNKHIGNTLFACLSFHRIVLPLHRVLVNESAHPQVMIEPRAMLEADFSSIENANVFGSLVQSYITLTSDMTVRIDLAHIISDVISEDFSVDFAFSLIEILLDNVQYKREDTQQPGVFSSKERTSDIVYRTYHPMERLSDEHINKIVLLLELFNSSVGYFSHLHCTESGTSKSASIAPDFATKILVPIILVAGHSCETLRLLAAKTLRNFMETSLSTRQIKSLVYESLGILIDFWNMEQTSNTRIKKLRKYVKERGGIDLVIPGVFISQGLSVLAGRPRDTQNLDENNIENFWGVLTDTLENLGFVSQPTAYRSILDALISLLEFKITREKAVKVKSILTCFDRCLSASKKKEKKKQSPYLFHRESLASRPDRETSQKPGDASVDDGAVYGQLGDSSLFDIQTVGFKNDFASPLEPLDEETQRRLIGRTDLEMIHVFSLAKYEFRRFFEVAAPFVNERWEAYSPKIFTWMNQLRVCGQMYLKDLSLLGSVLVLGQVLVSYEDRSRFEVLYTLIRHLDLEKVIDYRTEKSVIGHIMSECRSPASVSHIFGALVLLSKRRPLQVLDGLVISCVIPEVTKIAEAVFRDKILSQDDAIKLRSALVLLSEYRFKHVFAVYDFTERILLGLFRERDVLTTFLRRLVLRPIRNIISSDVQSIPGKIYCSKVFREMLKIALDEPNNDVRLEILNIVSLFPEAFRLGLFKLNLFLDDPDDRVKRAAYKLTCKLSKLRILGALPALNRYLNMFVENLIRPDYGSSAPESRKRSALLDLEILNIILEYGNPSIFRGHKYKLLSILSASFDTFPSYSGWHNTLLLKAVNQLSKVKSDYGDSYSVLDTIKFVVDRFLVNFRRMKMTFNELKYSLIALKNLIRDYKLVIAVYHFRPSLYDVTKEIMGGYPQLELYASDLLATIGAIDPEEIEEINNWIERESTHRHHMKVVKGKSKHSMLTKKEEKLLSKLKMHKHFRNIPKYELDVRFSYPPTAATVEYYSQIKSLSVILNFLSEPKRYETKIVFSKQLKVFLKNFIPNEEDRKENALSKLAFPVMVNTSKKLLLKLQRLTDFSQKRQLIITLIESYLKNFVHLIRISREVSVMYFYKILRVVVGCWNYSSLLPSSVAVVKELCAFDEFYDDIARTVLPVFLPEMANLLQRFGQIKDEKVFLTILEILDITDISSTYSDLIIPALLSLLTDVFSDEHQCGRMDMEISIRIIKILFDMALTKDIFKQVFTILEHVLRIQSRIEHFLTSSALKPFLEHFLELVSVRFPIPEPLIPYLETLMISNKLGKNSVAAKIFSSRNKRTVSNICKDFTEIYNHSKESFLSCTNQYGKLKKRSTFNFSEMATALGRKESVPWEKWMADVKAAALRNSPQMSIRTCSPLVKFEASVADDLFELSFFTIWNELGREHKRALSELIRRNVFQADTPRDILVEFLDLVDFIEMCDPDQGMGFDTDELFQIAEECKAYGKALRYKELDYQNSFSNEKLGELIRINSKLMLKDSAKGLLELALGEPELKVSVDWLEELKEWNRVLEVYDKMDGVFYAERKRLECYRALGDWKRLNQIVDNIWFDLPYEQRVEISDHAVRGAWFRRDLEAMEEYIRYLPDDINGNFLKSIYYVLAGDYGQAKQKIQRTKRLALQEFRSLKSSKMIQKTVQDGSYESYAMLVGLHQLGELEEIIKYKKGKIDIRDLKILWQRRLFGTHQSISVWRDILSVHEIVMPGSERPSVYSKYTKICYENGNRDLSNHTLRHIIEDAGFRVVGTDSDFFISRESKEEFEVITRKHPKTYYTYLKYKFLYGHKKEAIDGLGALIQISGRSDCAMDFVAKMNLKYAKWALKEFDSLEEYGIPFSDIEKHIANAIRIDSDWAKPYRLYADFYLKAAELDEGSREERLTLAVSSMIRSISNSIDGGTIHELLRLLTTWFNYYSLDGVFDTFKNEYQKISALAWINVTPQLLSRLHHHEGHVKNLLREIISNVATSYPQALVFPVTVSRSNRDHQNHIDPANSKQNEAKVILDEMRLRSPVLVKSAEIVAVELLRVSILWPEIWNSGLDEFKYLFKHGDYEGLKTTIVSLYEMIEKGGETKLEQEFLEHYKKVIDAGYKIIKKIIGVHVAPSRQKQVIKKSWKHFGVVHKSIKEEIPRLKSFRLEDASVMLKTINASSGLAVPGTYKPQKRTIFIESFDDYVEVVKSKQRPRKIRIKGSNGESFQYLLKGHEDLRQDERVMQVVELINNLIMSNPRLKRMEIQKFPVIPLSFNSGLIGWIKDSKTIHHLVLERRIWKERSLGSELRRIHDFWPNYNDLPRIAKVEAREYGMESEDGNDIADVLWAKSKRNEEWISKREMYTSSLSTMSMVGYILGLGDRHPNNLMMTESNGKISHIDFGDCFEVAMERKVLAEKVPFRLTRMLIHGMGIPGENGTFKRNSEKVMEILRDNKDQISTILEAHVYDPLFQWVFEKKDRLVRIDAERKIERKTSSRMPRDESQKQKLNRKALKILGRVRDKLSGRDFGERNSPLSVKEQVGNLIKEATDPYNISAHYIGWCPFW